MTEKGHKVRKILLGALALSLCPIGAEAQVPPPWGKVGITASLSNTVTTIKTTPGQIGNVLCYNSNASVAYVQFFNSVAAGVVLGTTTPYYIVPVPAGLNGGYAMSPGLSFDQAISYAATTTATGSTAPVTGITCSWGIY